MSILKIYGHKEIVKRLYAYSENGSLSHAHLIVGDDGNGKSKIAKELSLLILDKKEDRDYIDIVSYDVGKDKSSIGIEDIRDLIEETGKKPFEGEKKVIIIHQGDKMTPQAQNALLKTVEEPLEGVHIIILTRNINDIIETIRSRCQIHNLWKIPLIEVKHFLEDNYPNLGEEEVKSISSFSDGIIGRAIDFLENDEFKEIRENSINILEDITTKEGALLKYIPFFTKYKSKYNELLTWIISFMRDILVYKETNDKGLVLNIDMEEKIKALSPKYSIQKINRLTKIVVDTGNDLESNVNPELSLSNMLHRMQEVFNG